MRCSSFKKIGIIFWDLNTFFRCLSKNWLQTPKSFNIFAPKTTLKSTGVTLEQELNGDFYRRGKNPILAWFSEYYPCIIGFMRPTVNYLWLSMTRARSRKVDLELFISLKRTRTYQRYDHQHRMIEIRNCTGRLMIIKKNCCCPKSPSPHDG